MTVGADLRTFLLADTAIAASIAARVYPVQLPQKPTLPAIAYRIVSGFRPHSMPNTRGLARPRVQIDCYSDSYEGAQTLADLVRKRLDAYRGAAGTATWQGVFFSNENDDFDPDTKLYTLSRDYTFWVEETA